MTGSQSLHGARTESVGRAGTQPNRAALALGLYLAVLRLVGNHIRS